MLDNSKAKIFLAGDRGLTETDWFRKYHTFNFDSHHDQYKAAYQKLYVLNDEALAPGRSVSVTVEDDSDVVLLPIVGTLHYQDDQGNDTLITAGEIQIFTTPKGSTLQLTNPHEHGLINWLQIWMKTSLPGKIQPEILSFDIQNDKNNLIELYTNKNTKYLLGKFLGREEITYELSQNGRSAFVFVVEGAFEVQYRLLEVRDGLAIWNLPKVEIEALSNDAIILLIEL